MTDLASTTSGLVGPSHHTSPEAMDRLRKRYAQEARFKAFGIAAVCIALGVLGILLGTLLHQGLSAFVQTEARVSVFIDPEVLDPQNTGDETTIFRADWPSLVNEAMYERFPDATGRDARRTLREIMSSGAGYELRTQILNDRDLIGQTIDVWLPVRSDLDQIHKGNIDRDLPQDRRPRGASDAHLTYYDAMVETGDVAISFNTRLFTNGDSRDPEMAGLWGAIVGSFYALCVCLLISFPVGVAAAVYLEEFAPKNRWTDLIEVNINNLAAVPSIIFGLLGLAVFIQMFGLPRSAPLVGGMVLSLMTLPTIIIAARASLKAVPPSIREAALGIGASKLQTIGHHVLPLAMPGILTGTIIGMAQALGETAPLLMIGMNAFVTTAPDSLTSPSAALPVQVYIWSDSPERGFTERTSAAILVLLAFLITMNALAIWLRRRFERRW